MEEIYASAVIYRENAGTFGSEYEEFLASFEHEKYQALRLNPLKRDDMSVITEKVKQTFQLQPVPWAENGYYYTKEDQPGKTSLA